MEQCDLTSGQRRYLHPHSVVLTLELQSPGGFVETEIAGTDLPPGFLVQQVSGEAGESALLSRSPDTLTLLVRGNYRDSQNWNTAVIPTLPRDCKEKRQILGEGLAPCHAPLPLTSQAQTASQWPLSLLSPPCNQFPHTSGSRAPESKSQSLLSSKPQNTFQRTRTFSPRGSHQMQGFSQLTPIYLSIFLGSSSDSPPNHA